MDFELSQEQNIFYESVSKFAANEPLMMRSRVLTVMATLGTLQKNLEKWACLA